MKYLLDTNIVILAFTDDPALPNEALDILNSLEYEKYVSIASIWEIAIKRIKAPERMPIPCEETVRVLEAYGIPLLPIIPEHIFKLATLHTTSTHKDPFDRLLIAQAKHEEMFLLTCDGNLDGYHEPFVHVVTKR